MLIRNALLSCLLAASTLTAQADDNTVRASASLTEFSFDLIDLTPQDDEVPQLIFYNRSVGGQAGLWQTYEGAYNGTLGDQYLYADGTARVDRNGAFSTAIAQLHAASVLVQAGTDVGGIAQSEVNEYYWLSPNTQMTVHWLAETTAGHSSTNDGQSSIEVYSDIFLSAAGSYDWDRQTISTTSADAPRSESLSFQWSTGDTAATGVFRLNTLARVGPSVPAVPEPETWAMWLAGLALCGSIALRKQRGT